MILSKSTTQYHIELDFGQDPENSENMFSNRDYVSYGKKTGLEIGQDSAGQLWVRIGAAEDPIGVVARNITNFMNKSPLEKAAAKVRPNSFDSWFRD